MSEWISVFKKKPYPEERILLQTESGEIVTGWLRELTADDIYYCFGNESAGWDFEFNFDLGSVTHWMPLPQPPQSKE